jgi:hypothetical protein
MYNTIQIKRRLPNSAQGPGAPASLSGGELAYNEIDNTLYYGASATINHGSVIAIGGPGMFVDRTTTQRISGEKTFFDIATFENQVNLQKSLSVTENVSANKYFIDGSVVIDNNRDATFNHIKADGNLTVTGNLSVLGTQTVINTQTINISGTSTQIDVVNNGTATGITVNQTGSENVAEFYDDSAIALAIVDGGNVGIGTLTPNEKLTVSGNISASQNIFAVNGDFTVSLDADGATTLGSTLYVTNAATFASSVSAAGALTIDGTARVNSDLTVVDKIQVQSSDFNPGVAGTHVEVEGTTVKVVQDGATEVTATYGLNGISTANTNATYTIQTDNNHEILISASGGGNDIDLQASNVNITTGDL